MARSGLIFSASTSTSSASTKLSPSLKVGARVSDEKSSVFYLLHTVVVQKASAACLLLERNRHTQSSPAQLLKAWGAPDN